MTWQPVATATGQTYYYCPSTGQTSWTNPNRISATARALPVATATPVAGASGKRMLQDTIGDPKKARARSQSRHADRRNLVNKLDKKMERMDAAAKNRRDKKGKIVVPPPPGGGGRAGGGPPPLPPHWSEVNDASSGSTYYWNDQTNETSWTRPAPPKPKARPKAAPAHAPPPPPKKAVTFAATVTPPAASGNGANKPLPHLSSTLSEGGWNRKRAGTAEREAEQRARVKDLGTRNGYRVRRRRDSRVVMLGESTRHSARFGESSREGGAGGGGYGAGGLAHIALDESNSKMVYVHPQVATKFDNRARRRAGSMTMDDDDRWHNILRKHHDSKARWTDPQFPPDARSLFKDPAKASAGGGLKDSHGGGLKPEDVACWRRIGDVYGEDGYRCVVQLTIMHTGNTDAEADFSVCGYRISPTKLRAAYEAKKGESLPAAARPYARVAAAYCAAAAKGDKAALARLSFDQLKTPLVDDNVVKRDCCDPALPMAFSRCDVDGARVAKHTAQPGYCEQYALLLPLYFSGQVRLFAGEGADADGDGKIDLSDFDKDGDGNLDIEEIKKHLATLVERGDVRQGKLGDCYLLGAISMLAENPLHLMHVFPDVPEDCPGPDSNRVPGERAGEFEQVFNRGGVYALRLYDGNDFRIVVVDDWLPCDSDGTPSFAKPAPEDTDGIVEIWPLIVEKAYAKFKGSYEAIVGGLTEEALHDLTGGLPVSHDLAKLRGRPDALWQNLLTMKKEQSVMGCAMHAAAKMNIIPFHAYGIVKAVELKVPGARAPVRVVHLRNPWGSGEEWNGAWCDDDPRWKKVSKREKERVGFVDEEDGTFFVPFEEWMSLYTNVCCCRRLLPPKWTHHHVVGQWAGPAATSKARLRSPQVQLKIERDCRVFASLRLRDRDRVIVPRKGGGDPEEQYPSHGVLVASKVDEWGKRHVHLWRNNYLGHKPGAGGKGSGALRLTHNRSALLELDLAASDGPFAFVCATGDSPEGWEAPFILDIFTDAPSELTPVEDVTDKTAPRCGKCGKMVDDQFSFYPSDASKLFHRECT